MNSKEIKIDDLCAILPPVRAENSHKYSFGRLQLVAGSKSYPGAARICALGAFKSGCGYVSLESDCPNEILRDLPELVPGFLNESDAFVLGPGFDNAWTLGRVTALIHRIPKSMSILLDGGALKYLSQLDLLKEYKNVLVTPHEAELAKILGRDWKAKGIRDKRELALEEFSNRFPHITLLLKGATTSVLAGDRIVIMNWGSPAMATAGQGDLLAGVIGAYLALSSLTDMSMVECAILGASLCALSVKNLSKNAEAQGILAHEVAAEIPRTLFEVRQNCSQ